MLRSPAALLSFVTMLAICLSLGSLVRAQDDPPPKDDPPAKDEPAEKGDGNEAKEDSPDKEEPKQEAEKETPQRRPVRTLIKGNEKVKGVFRTVVADARQATVAVLAKGKQVALGTIVDANGFVLTKASELGEELECKLSDGRLYEATFVGLHTDTDLAMLKIDVDDLAAIQWREGKPPALGAWLATPGTEEDPVSIGVVSVEPRKIPPASGMLGVFLEPGNDKGTRINQVMPGSAAEKAGLRVNDVVIKLNGNDIKSRQQLIDRIRRFGSGDTVTLTVKRGEDVLQIVAILGSRDEGSGNRRRNFQNSLGGRLSGRRRDFQSVLQHDTVLAPNQCGGAIVDLDGRAVGINIARAGRVESYALPVSLIKPLLKKLRSGELAPSLVRLDEVGKQLSNLRQVEDVMTRRAEQLKEALASAKETEKAAQEAAEKAAAAFEKAKHQAAESEKTAKAAREELDKHAAKIKKLADEKKKLEAAVKQVEESQPKDVSKGSDSKSKDAPDEK